MIVHVWRRGLKADLGPVTVATRDPEIAHSPPISYVARGVEADCLVE
jgi:hypothetical protein